MHREGRIGCSQCVIRKLMVGAMLFPLQSNGVCLTIAWELIFILMNLKLSQFDELWYTEE